MRQEVLNLLNLARLPARLNAAEAAAVLGVAEHDMRILTKAGLVKPLGRPAANACKWFAAVEIERLGKDLAIMARITRAISDYWESRNRRRKNKPSQPGDLPLAA